MSTALRTLIFDWSRLDPTAGSVPTSGSVSLTPVRRSVVDGSVLTDAPIQVAVSGRAEVTVPVTGGEGPAAYRLRWAPVGAPSWTTHVLVPPGGPVLAHELPTVDPATLTPGAEPAPIWEARLAEVRDAVAAIPAPDLTGLITRADLDAALAAVPQSTPSHIAVTAEGRLVHRVGGTTTLTTTTSGRLAAVRA